MFTIFENDGFTGIRQIMSDELNPFILSWSHYLILMRIKNEQERRFYEIEAKKQSWSFKQLQREYNSSLYERLALSRNKDAVMQLSQEDQIIEKPQDLLKNPLSLEFLGLAERAEYVQNGALPICATLWRYIVCPFLCVDLCVKGYLRDSN